MRLEWEQVVIDALDPETSVDGGATRFGGSSSTTIRTSSRSDPGQIRLPGIIFEPVQEPKHLKNRLHLDFRPNDQNAEVKRLIELGACRLDIGQGEVSWVVLADPEGNEFCVLQERQTSATDNAHSYTRGPMRCRRHISALPERPGIAVDSWSDSLRVARFSGRGQRFRAGLGLEAAQVGRCVMLMCMISERFNRAWRRLVAAFTRHQNTPRDPEDIETLGAARWDLEQARNEMREAAEDLKGASPPSRAPRKVAVSEDDQAKIRVRGLGDANRA